MRYTVGGHKNEANTEHTCVLSGKRRGGGILSGEMKGGSSYLVEWRDGSMFSGVKGKATAVTRAERENSKTIVKQKNLRSAGLDMCTPRRPSEC